MNKIILQVFIIINMMTSLLYGERMRLAILDFEAKEGISKATVTTASEWIRTEMINTKHFTVIERTAMNEILQEQAFSTTGCTETSCAVKLGRLLSARKILIGSIAKWRKKIIINGRIIDVEKGVAEFAHKESISSLDDLDIGVSSFAKNLSKRIQGYTVNPSASNGKYSQNNLQPLTRLNKSFSGTWKTTYGKLIMTKNGNKVTGTYYNGAASIKGTVVGNRLNFVWIESHMSGRGYFILSSDCTSFTGGWNLGSGATTRWNGNRID